MRKLFLRVRRTHKGRALAPALSALVLAVLAGCTGRPEGIEPVRSFDVSRYRGEWFEVMRLDHRFERGLTHVSALYTPRADGTIGVVNKGFDPQGCRWKQAEGRAVLQEGPDTASLSVSFFPPFAGGYHVFSLDRRNYAWAMVAGPTRDYLWILARRPDLDPSVRNRLVAEAKALGFPVERLILVEHGPRECR
jgi:apolipoprotein D and lipocalin family protein